MSDRINKLVQRFVLDTILGQGDSISFAKGRTPCIAVNVNRADTVSYHCGSIDLILWQPLRDTLKALDGKTVVIKGVMITFMLQAGATIMKLKIENAKGIWTTLSTELFEELGDMFR